MLAVRKRQFRGDGGSGFVWPKSGNNTTEAVKSIFGPRLFPLHATTVGYNYDWHRGIDLPINGGDIVHVPIGGSVVRMHETHYGFESLTQLQKFVKTDPNSCATFSYTAPTICQIRGVQTGAVTGLAGVARLAHKSELFVTQGDDWNIEVAFGSIPSLVGRAGIAVVSPDLSQYVALEYDGTTCFLFGVGAGGALGSSGTSVAIGGQLWLRISYTFATTTLAWQCSVDGDTWYTLASTSTGVTFTNGACPIFTPWLYYRPTTSGGGLEVVDIDALHWVDTQTIGRHGNWYLIADGAKRVGSYHNQELLVSLGDIVVAGQAIALAGETGYDARSGRISFTHAHVEVLPGTPYTYFLNDPINPLGTPYFPRVDVTSNVSVTGPTLTTDPEGNAAWKLSLLIARGNEDFDTNTVMLVGSLATRTVNFNTRAGLNSDNDVPINSGVRIDPAADFDDTNATKQLDFYFWSAVVGTVTSWTVLDTEGRTLASG